MNDIIEQAPVSLSISAVERDTGIAKDTLRVWERRYGFPDPDRDQFGERVYNLAQVDKLRLIRRLLDLGHRPGRIVRYSLEELHKLAAQAAPVPERSRSVAWLDNGFDELMGHLKAHRIAELRLKLAQMVLRLGVERFVVEVAAPASDMISEALVRGDLAIYEEHLYAESILVVMRNAISSIPAQPATSPCVLMTTFPNEQHVIGLLMAEAMLALYGCRCISLGTQTPVFEIAAAAVALQADIVVLSFTTALNPNLVLDGIAQLRDELPANVELWVGGRCPNTSRRTFEGVSVLRSLGEIRSDLERWHRQHQS